MARILTVEELEAELRDDIKVKVAGIDVDGVMRGKVLAKDKFMSAVRAGFGFCRFPRRQFPLILSVIFGWDIHDKVKMQLLLLIGSRCIQKNS